MADRSEPYDPPYPAEGDPNNRVNGLKSQIQGVSDTMRDNIRLASDRGESINNLQQRTDDLSGAAQEFNRGAHKVRKQMWWKNTKMIMLVTTGVVIILVIIIVASIVGSRQAK